jgi:hypothetical protein
MQTKDRLHQFVLIGSTLLLSWLGMMVVHELGHVLGAWWTGGKVARVVLHPLVISRTDLAHNPNPLWVAWAGPICGVLIPLALWIAALVCRMPGAYVVRLFAGFCLLANGAYIGIGSFTSVGDTGDLLRHGATIWQLWLFGFVFCPAGVLLWHGLGRHFALGDACGRVDVTTAYVCLSLLVLVVMVEVFLLSS